MLDHVRFRWKALLELTGGSELCCRPQCSFLGKRFPYLVAAGRVGPLGVESVSSPTISIHGAAGGQRALGLSGWAPRSGRSSNAVASRYIDPWPRGNVDHGYNI